MVPQFDNLVLSSFLLYLDHQICYYGSGYQTVTTEFYPVNSKYNGYTCYASPYRQITIDTSLPGVVPFTGAYLGNTFVTTGVSGLKDIDYENGRIYFSTRPSSSVSGSYTIKDFNIEINSESEEELLFAKKLTPRPKISINPTGLSSEERPYPIIYIHNESVSSEGFAFGGTQKNNYLFKVIIFSDSQFKLDAVKSICRDLNEKYVPILSAEEFPFNNLGGLRSGVYNYNQLTEGKVTAGSGVFINKVYSANAFRYAYNTPNLNPEVKVGILVFDIEAIRNPST